MATGTSVSVASGATETHYVPGMPEYDAVRLVTDSGNSTSTDVTVEIRTWGLASGGSTTTNDDDVNQADANGDFSSMSEVSRTTAVDPSSGDPIFGTTAVGRIVAIRVTENSSGGDYSGTIEFHRADDQGRSAERFVDPYNASKQPQQTVAATPGFGTWTDNTGGVGYLLMVDATVETDGTSEGRVDLDVDEGGGTTADYSFTVAHVDEDNATGAQNESMAMAYVPPGGSYQINNASDPNGNNAINVVRRFEQP